MFQRALIPVGILVLSLSLIGCATNEAPKEESSPVASPTAQPVAIKESGSCSELQSSTVTLDAAYDEWVSNVKFVATFDDVKKNYRGWLVRQVWAWSATDIYEFLTGVNKILENGNNTFQNEISQLTDDLQFKQGYLVPAQQASIDKLNVTLSNLLEPFGEPSNNMYDRALAAWDLYPTFSIDLHAFITDYCE